MFPMTLFYLKLSHKCLPRPTDCLNYEKKEDITTYFQRVINTLKIIWLNRFLLIAVENANSVNIEQSLLI